MPPGDRCPPIPIVRLQNPGLPPPGFSFGGCCGSGLGDRDARADRESGELIDGGAAGAPIRKLIFIELRRHMRMPFAGYRPHHRAGVELAAIHLPANRPSEIDRWECPPQPLAIDLALLIGQRCRL
jgi:hypothetical protein